MKISEFVKKSLNWIKAIIIIIIILTPYIILWYVLRKQNKTIVIHPEFGIKDIEKEEEIDTNIAKDVIQKGQDILKKFEVIDDEKI